MKKKQEETPKRKKYEIVVNYDTGDSFNQYLGEECSIVEEWDNLDIAKENLKRIEAHNNAHKKIEGWGNYGKSSWNDYKGEAWFSKKYPQHAIFLLKDDGTKYEENTISWTGYFESMNYAEIRHIVQKENDMKIYG